MAGSKQALLAQLPRVDSLLEHVDLAQSPWRRTLVRAAVREVLDRERARRLASSAASASPALVDETQWVQACLALLRQWTTPGPRPVINATGVLLHTNLGRAPLSDAASRAMVDAAGACDLEFDLESGRRGSRFDALRPLLRVTCEAEDAHVVTNGAAALLLACTALGRRTTGDTQREGVVLCRAQMVEIGDGFRIATMAAAGGVPVVEVGATNRSHLRDYEAALDPAQGGRAAAILWAHASNFEQSGFVKQPSLEALASLAQRFEVPLIADLGSGSLGGELPEAEPTIQAYLRAGADLVTCSGDKLLGGPQAGIMAGRADLVHACRRFAMARALRPGKATLAALHATLVAHVREGPTELPLHAMLRRSIETLRERGQSILRKLDGAVQLRESTATIGGGALPGDARESLAVVVPARAGRSAAQLAAALRRAVPPVVGRIEDDALWLDLRSVDPAQDDALAQALGRAMA